ncbi:MULTISPECIES: phage baseplate plug protein [Leptospira]|uniref:Cyanophage baseplate Pam3 plug gp18 domain-containing protein n=1 Tax=Leptospira borgpetersenii serovar Javanica str. UI 09931 TaxID=1049767 RepID=A0AAV3J5G5_LEPBO|nr:MULTISPECIES: hypothetical protein [Leptospira]EKQ90503.1 hypothetical protein LEP1GSC101_0436 [Leptospira borgpetersenii str. UI 09149]EMK12922.1 hypothetical protein LEP1GSC066_1077 [Leptospira sp. serovar Kenya str. Sh9]EMN59735.1 hypothetical protein LEP1GSC090_2715 [Leptospira borgpetersenii serovar Javanica str. MK146]EPG56106.1 hypothetical protein LEP1GSC103_0668 [Leptospira borgpetersenii serovar Javanica str. UI 09931]MDQ7245908.1 hypothetical protein [Leptospira borgpetersenii]
MIQSLPIRFEELPVSKIFQIGNKDFEFELRYNSRFDFISLYVKEGTRFLHSCKLVYGIDCLSGFADFSLTPLSLSDLAKTEYEDLPVNKDTFGKNVLLFFDDGKG